MDQKNSKNAVSKILSYHTGFGNEFESEAQGYEGVLPQGHVNPQDKPFGLYDEQISGSAFTAPRVANKRSWFYRIQPSVCHKPFKQYSKCFDNLDIGHCDPNQRRWFPFTCTRWGDISSETMIDRKINFVDGIHTLCKSANLSNSSGQPALAIHIYLANTNMVNTCFQNADGDLLIVPQQGSLLINTEFGDMLVEPEEICVIQQGMNFTVTSPDLDNRDPNNNNNHRQLSDSHQFIRGYILEVIGSHFELPTLGLIGSNCLANPRDFQTPKAKFACNNNNNKGQEFTIIKKFHHRLFEAKQDHSPYDVVAWFGNYVPYKYDCRKFIAVNSVTRDHPDPSIFTVLTCPLPGKPGTALADFVIFPPRWEAASDTFRPPYFHRNIMTEFMGLIKGNYQAKSNLFAPGGATLHQSMTPHGPDKQCFDKALEQSTDRPARVADNTLAFMFETSFTLMLTEFAYQGTECEDSNYYQCWQKLEPRFAKSQQEQQGQDIDT